MNDWLILIGAIVFIFFLFKYDENHNLNAQEASNKYTWHGAIPPLAIGIVFLSVSVASKSPGLYFLTATYFIWFIIQLYKAYKNRHNS